MFTLVSVIISIVLAVVDITLNSGWFSGLYLLAVLVPGIAVGVRRLHDTGRSGWWLLTWLIPLIGWVWIIVYFAEAGDPQPNAYGPNPKAPVDGPAA